MYIPTTYTCTYIICPVMEYIDDGWKAEKGP
jgi:hypothetical protein